MSDPANWYVEENDSDDPADWYTEEDDCHHQFNESDFICDNCGCDADSGWFVIDDVYDDEDEGK